MPQGLPIEAYAPAVMAYGGALYYSACDIGLYRSRDPKGGKWEHVGDPFKVGDPDLFADDDGRVYLYYGLSYNGAIPGRSWTRPAGFKNKGAPFVCFRADFAHHGWERRGEDNLGAVGDGQFSEGPWIEGAWMTKHGGTLLLAVRGARHRVQDLRRRRLHRRRRRAGRSPTRRRIRSRRSRPASSAAPATAPPSPTSRGATGTSPR